MIDFFYSSQHLSVLKLYSKESKKQQGSNHSVFFFLLRSLSHFSQESLQIVICSFAQVYSWSSIVLGPSHQTTSPPLLPVPAPLEKPSHLCPGTPVQTSGTPLALWLQEFMTEQWGRLELQSIHLPSLRTKKLCWFLGIQTSMESAPFFNLVLFYVGVQLISVLLVSGVQKK